MRGQIIKLISNQYLVLLEDKRIVPCIAMGKLRLGNALICGDYVEVKFYQHQNAIEKLYERKNQLIRPPIANIDQAFIVMSAINPDFSTTLVDQLIFLISCNNIKPIIIVTKIDLVDKRHFVYRLIEDYQKSGYLVFLTGKNISPTPIIEAIQGKVTVLAGQSGAGKSSLVNRINPELKLSTQEISKALGRGKHTTRHVEFFAVGSGWLADTPGFSKLDFTRISKELLRDSVPDFKKYQGQCRFRDCFHQNEPDCIIKAGVEAGSVSKARYYHYIDCLKVIESEGRKHYE